MYIKISSYTEVMVSPLSNQLHINNECYNNDAGFQCIFWKAQYNIVSKASSCMLSHSISTVQLKLSIIISVLAWSRINTVCKMQRQLEEVSIDIVIASCIKQCAAFLLPFFPFYCWVWFYFSALLQKQESSKVSCRRYCYLYAVSGRKWCHLLELRHLLL